MLEKLISSSHQRQSRFFFKQAGMTVHLQRLIAILLSVFFYQVLKLIYMYGYFACIYVFVPTTCVLGSYGGQKRTLDPPGPGVIGGC